jgi:two-component system, chemotaxis family, protein-glutamate methylesterase/glutaminase
MPHSVLIVDDSGLMRNTIRQIVAVDPEFEVVGEAEDGVVALEQMRALKPDLVLLDIEMPKLDGIAVLKRARLTSSAKVIILSSLAQLGSPQALEARRIGAAEVIAKPSGTISLDLKAKRGSDILRALRSVLGLPPLDASAAAAHRAQSHKDG